MGLKTNQSVNSKHKWSRQPVNHASRHRNHSHPPPPPPKKNLSVCFILLLLPFQRPIAVSTDPQLVGTTKRLRTEAWRNTCLYPFCCNIPPRPWSNRPAQYAQVPWGHLLKMVQYSIENALRDLTIVSPPPRYGRSALTPDDEENQSYSVH